MTNFGFCNHNEVWDKFHRSNLDVGDKVIWNNEIYIVEYDPNIDLERHRWGLGITNEKFKEPKRNEKCYCGSNKKYKKCCL